ncbi:MAG: alkaline phosphatase D family protein [Opitutae bacterium]
MKLSFRCLLFCLTALCWALNTHAAGTLVSGPMLGYRAHREAFLWFETKDAKQVTLDYWLAGKPETKQTITQSGWPTTPAGGQIAQFRPGLLAVGANYEYTLSIDGVRQTFPFPTTFRTSPLWEWRGPPSDFKFIFGTCAYFNEPAYDRPGPGYGKTMETFRLMADSGADFMLWGGDNWYYREVDFDSVSGLWYRAQLTRALPELRKLFAVMPHYAAWDDHDYGSNDSNKSFEFKDETLRIFKAYWGNPTYGEEGNPGVYQKFYQGDAAFLVMDNRMYRDDDHLLDASIPQKSQYGARQLDWLKQSLLHAQTLGFYSFKFIVTGGQVVTDFGGASETFAYYQREREDLLKFIKDQGITGVVFLTGDVHFTELAKKNIGGTRWVYELTSSPMSAGVSTLGQTERLNDPHRVPGTLVSDQNFCTLAIHGPKEARVLTIACIDKQGVTRWTQDIKAEDLR